MIPESNVSAIATKPRDWAVQAIKRGKPTGRVPHFERFELNKEVFGKPELTLEEMQRLSAKEREKRLAENVELFATVADKYDYSIVRVWGIEGVPEELEMIRRLREAIGGERLIAATSDGTFKIPTGSELVNVAYSLADKPDEMHARYENDIRESIERIKRLVDAGAECIYMNSDYCFNSGPFLSPTQFGEFVAPYLQKQVEAIHRAGAYAIKHTDGNIMPIAHQMVDCGIDVLQSLDPQGGIDLAEIKKEIGDRVCLAGNVDCCLLQSGKPEHAAELARIALEKGMPGGGYIFMSSNTIFFAIPPENYEAMWNVWREKGQY